MDFNVGDRVNVLPEGGDDTLTGVGEVTHVVLRTSVPGRYYEVDLDDGRTCCPSAGYLEAEEHGAHNWRMEQAPVEVLAAPAGPVAVDPNPKKAFGATKPDLALVPPVGTLHQAMAHELGAEKYGAYNWRLSPVEAMTYIGAIGRHLQAYLDGEEYTSDTLFEEGDLVDMLTGVEGAAGVEGLGMVHNLGAIMASCAILLDSMELGILIDNRPPKGRASAVQTRLQALKKARAARKKA